MTETGGTGSSQDGTRTGGIGQVGVSPDNGAHVETGGARSDGAAANGGAAASATVAGGGPSGGVAASAPVASGGVAAGVPATGGSAVGGPATGGIATGGFTAAGAATFGDTGGAGVGGGGATAGAPAEGGARTGGGPPDDTATGGSLSGPVTLYIASDSTAATYTDTASPNDQAGWGQMLHEVFSNDVTIVNLSAGGRTALWFYLEGGVDRIVETIAPGDYLFVQFGTNDGNQTATFTVNGTTYPRYAAPSTDFKTYLKDYYIDPARSADAHPVLVTPPPRNSAYCGKGNSLGGYAQAMRELGEAEGVPVLDLNTKTFDYLAAICPSPTPEDFFFVRSDGTVDGTHFQENGARHMAGFLAECIRDVDLALENYLLP